MTQDFESVASALWSQYLSDGTEASLLAYKRHVMPRPHDCLAEDKPGCPWCDLIVRGLVGGR